MSGIIAIILIAWTICAVITYAFIGHIDPYEVEGFEALAMFLCLDLWPFLALIGIVYMVCKWLSHLGDWVRGFLEGLFGEYED